MRVRNTLLAIAVLVAGTMIAPAAEAAGTVKLAFFNIQSGKGEVGLAGRPVLFADTQNCTDRTRPVNAWGVGFVQDAIVGALRDDPSVVALGLAEAWVCGSPENVRKLLGWAAKTSTRNGVGVVARYGFAGPEAWQQLDTSRNPDPADTKWVVRVPVCTDAACSASIVMYAAHWYATGTTRVTTYNIQAQQTLDFMARTTRNEPHVLIGDLNAWEGTSRQCGQSPTNAGVPKLRAASYIDAWPRIHGTAEGFTGMTNRTGCGNPAGYTWKRIDYAWSSPGLEPIDMTRFAMPEVTGDAAASDHYGILVTYPAPGADAPGDTVAPVVTLVSPSSGAVVSGPLTIDVAASDNTGLARVEAILDGRTLPAGTSSPYQVALDATSLLDGIHSVQARAYDAAGNVSVSPRHSFEVKNAIVLPPITAIPLPALSAGEIVLHAHRARTVVGSWKPVNDASAAGGAAMANPNAGRAKLSAALATPAHYFEMTFTPAPGVPYRLWIRGRAQNNSWANDSVFVQFSGSISATGGATYRIGSTASTVVNLEDASGAGLDGWGWQDNGYGANVLGRLIHFDGKPQTIRIQPREDGLSIDQIVLSPATYLTAAPGALKRDSTIVPEPLFTAAAAPTLDEIVLHASTPAVFAGAWGAVSDTTAVDSVAITHPDARRAKLSSALAAPVDYVELTFDAQAGRDYRLWIRARADANSWANDSVFVQFSGAVDAGGAPVYRIGTTEATVVNLEDGVGAGLSGWGWQDNGYGAGVLGTLIRFQRTGRQTIRIQTREDGLRLDHILLSSARYLTTAPGTLTNDATIVR